MLRMTFVDNAEFIDIQQHYYSLTPQQSNLYKISTKRAFLLPKVCPLPVRTGQMVLPVQSLVRNRHYSGPASGRQLQPQTDKTRTRGRREHGAPSKDTRPTRQRCTRLMQIGVVPPSHYVENTVNLILVCLLPVHCIFTELNSVGSSSS